MDNESRDGQEIVRSDGTGDDDDDDEWAASALNRSGPIFPVEPDASLHHLHFALHKRPRLRERRTKIRRVRLL